MGDYVGMAANSWAGAMAPLVIASAPGTALRQNFFADPPQRSNIQNFRPNFVPYPLGSDLRFLGNPLTPEISNKPPLWKGKTLRLD
jgi:hypothetical protein